MAFLSLLVFCQRFASYAYWLLHVLRITAFTCANKLLILSLTRLCVEHSIPCIMGVVVRIFRDAL